MNVRRLLTVAQLAIHFGRSISEIETALDEEPRIKPVARADSAYVYDGEALTLIRHRLEQRDLLLEGGEQ
jgi:hypothetical protein